MRARSPTLRSCSSTSPASVPAPFPTTGCAARRPTRRALPPPTPMRPSSVPSPPSSTATTGVTPDRHHRRRPHPLRPAAAGPRRPRPAVRATRPHALAGLALPTTEARGCAQYVSSYLDARPIIWLVSCPDIASPPHHLPGPPFDRRPRHQLRTHPCHPRPHPPALRRARRRLPHVG